MQTTEHILLVLQRLRAEWHSPLTGHAAEHGCLSLWCHCLWLLNGWCCGWVEWNALQLLLGCLGLWCAEACLWPLRLLLLPKLLQAA